MRLHYSLSLWNYFHYRATVSLEKIIETAHELNYGIEFWSPWVDGRDIYLPSETKKLKALLNGMDISLHTSGANTFDLHKKQIDAASDIGAKVVVLHTEDFNVFGKSELDEEFAWQIVEYAEKSNVRIALENGRLDFLV